MKIHRDCGLSFKLWWILTFVFELISSGTVMAVGVFAFLSKVGRNVQLTYSPEPSTSYVVKNATYDIVVTSWILLVLFALCALRFVVAIILAVGIKKSSAELGKLWIAFKVFSVMISMFLATASFNVSLLVKVATLISLITDLVSSYFIRILYPELDKMSKFIVMKIDPK